MNPTLPLKLRYLAAMLIAGLAISSCDRWEYAQFDFELDQAEVRDIYEPLFTGQELLADTFGKLDYDLVVFDLERKKSRIHEDEVGEDVLLNETKAAFFGIGENPTQPASEILYFSPRRLRFESLTALLGAEATNQSSTGELIRTDSDHFSLFRSIPEKPGLLRRNTGRDIFRFDFELDSEGAIILVEQVQITFDEGVEYLPAASPDARGLIYLRRDEEGPNILMMAGFGGEEPQAVFEAQDFDIQHPSRTPDGRLVFSADPDGIHRVFQIPFPIEPVMLGAIGSEPQGPADSIPGARTATQSYPVLPAWDGNPVYTPPARRVMTPFDPTDPVAEEQSQIILASDTRSGNYRPALVALPGSYNLEAVTALVMARNPHVNKQRALLAAAAIEASESKLANWPIIDWGIFYTPIVGVFLDEPDTVSGDFISENISRGLLGLVQPLLDFRRNNAYTQAQFWRAEIARDVVLHEINERVAEAAELYFEAQYLRGLLDVDDEILRTVGERRAMYQRLRTSSEATLTQVLATENVLEGIESERDFHARRLGFLLSRIKEVCGLSESAPLPLADETFLFDQYEPEPLEQMRHTALLHHPDLKAARATMSQAFYLERMGADLRPTAYVGATYGQSRRDFQTGVDDFITLALQGKYPLASRRAKKLHKAKWAQTMQALRFERAAASRTIATAMEEAYMDFRAAQRDLNAKNASVMYQLEKLRVARVRLRLGPVDESSRVDPLVAVTARFDYLQAVAKTHKVRMDLGLRFSKLWREMGLASQLAERTAPWRDTEVKRNRASTWLWHTQDVLQSENSMREFVQLARARQIKRIYAYLYSDSRLLESQVTREKLTVFLNFCDQSDIELWGLLGEPEWVENGEVAAVDKAVDAVLAFNAGAGAYEPRIAGLKLDLEPHSIEGWNSDPARRAELEAGYLALVKRASDRLGGELELWTDVPVQYFRPENEQFLAAATALVDGATLMCYYDTEPEIISNARHILEQFPLPMEIGVEFSENAPPSDRLEPRDATEFRSLAGRLRFAIDDRPNFAGLAFHDYQALRQTMGSDE